MERCIIQKTEVKEGVKALKRETGIFYFSSTGNSLYIAKRIGAALGETAHYIPTFCGTVSQYAEIILVSPVYSFGLPKHVYDFLITLKELPSVTVVLNFGGMMGGADRYTYEVAEAHGIRLNAVHSVKMPENFTLTFSTLPFFNRIILRSAEKRIDAIIDAIQAGRPLLPAPRKTNAKTHETNKSNWHLLASDFTVTDACIRCRKCVELCPAHNIVLEDGSIRFLDRCVACLGCYHRCPQRAIRYKNKRKQDRYLNPSIEEAEIGTDV